MEMRGNVFQAIAEDPTLRKIIKLLAQRSLNLNAVAERFDITRPAVSIHIKILSECGIVTLMRQGIERYCKANYDKLKEVSDWVDQYRKF